MKPKRSFLKAFKDVFAAMCGKTYVSVRAYCFSCETNYYIEFYQDYLFPVRSRCKCPDTDSFDLMSFNNSFYFPSVKSRLAKEQPSVLENMRTGVS